MTEILSPIDAAYRLGVTPELLFAYASNPPKTSLGHDRTLPFQDDDGSGGFLSVDLDSFDVYLREPWAEEGKKRPAIPTYVKDYLKVECNGQCPKCGSGFRLEDAHIDPWNESRSHHHHNILRLCISCHKKFDTTNLVDRQKMKAIKEDLVADVRTRLHRPLDVLAARTRMPNPASCFVGRDADVAELATRLAQHRSVCIHGVAGIGKTQLLINTLKRVRDQRSVLWVDLESLQGHDDVLSILASVTPQNPPRLDRNAIYSAMDGMDIRVVLDGVERLSNTDMDQIVDLITEFLQYTTKPQLIVTSQVELLELDVDSHLAIGRLEDQSVRFVLENSPQAATGMGDGTEWLTGFCEGHPLTASVAVGLLNHFKSVAVVIQKIKSAGAAILQSPTRRRQTTKTSLQLCLELAYESLTLHQRNLLWVVANCPAGLWPKFMTQSGLRQLVPDVETEAAFLRRWHLVESNIDTFEHTRLFTLSPIRAFVEMSTGNDPAVDKRNLEFEFVQSHVMEIAVIDMNRMKAGDTRFGLLRYDSEFSNLLSAFRIATSSWKNDRRLLTCIGPMSTALMPYCFVRGWFGRGVSMLRAGVDAFLEQGMPSSASTALSQLSVLAGRMGNVELAKHAKNRILELAQESSDEQVLADAEIARGEILFANVFATGKWGEERRLAMESVKEYFQNAISLYSALKDKESSDDHPSHRISLAYQQLGFVSEGLAEFEEARTCYSEALRLTELQMDQVNIGSVHHGLANCAAGLGEYDKAVGHYLEAARRFADIGAFEHLSNSLSELGYVLVAFSPPTSPDQLINEELLADGLIDAANQIRVPFATQEFTPDKTHWVIRRTFGMIALTSFTSKNVMLEQWVEGLRSEIVIPMAARFRDENCREGIYLVMYLDVVLALAGSISSVSQPEGNGGALRDSELESFARLCWQVRHWLKHSFDVFKWLTVYAVRHRGMACIDSGELLAAAEAAEEYGEPFSLSGGTDHEGGTSCEDPNQTA